MQPRFRPAGKANDEKLSIRSALLVLLALYAALVDAALLYAAHQAIPLILVTAAGAFVGAFHFFDGLVED
jgi:hypothetical protein